MVVSTLVLATPLVWVLRLSCVPSPLTSSAHHPSTNGTVFVPSSIKRPSLWGPVPELVVVLFQDGLNQNLTVPLRQLIFADKLGSTSRYRKWATVLLSINTAFPFQLVTA